MKIQITNFPTSETRFTKKPFYKPSFEVINTSFEVNSSAYQSDKNSQDFEEILSNKELAKEMFPPDYFMLVE